MGLDTFLRIFSRENVISARKKFFDFFDKYGKLEKDEEGSRRIEFEGISAFYNLKEDKNTGGSAPPVFFKDFYIGKRMGYREVERQDSAYRMIRGIAEYIEPDLILFSHEHYQFWGYELTDDRFVPTEIGEFTYLNYFGPVWVDKIGRERLYTAPAYDVTEVGDGIAMRPFENFDDYSDAQRGALESHLGLEYFPED